MNINIQHQESYSRLELLLREFLVWLIYTTYIFVVVPWNMVLHPDLYFMVGNTLHCKISKEFFRFPGRFDALVP